MKLSVKNRLKGAQKGANDELSRFIICGFAPQIFIGKVGFGRLFSVLGAVEFCFATPHCIKGE